MRSIAAEAISTAKDSVVTTKKSALQPTESTSRPETLGPTAGAKPITSEMMPMALPRFSRGKMSRMTVKTMGMTAPVHAACSTRPASSSGKLGAKAASSDPAVKITKPPT